jgi:hypothetical protein
MPSRWLFHPIAATIRFFSRRVSPEEVTGISIFWTVSDQPDIFMLWCLWGSSVKGEW